MKKPKIKYMMGSGIIVVKSLTSEEVADAYSDMIDALIAVYHFEENTNSLDPETSIKVEQALKKAGCTE